MPITAKRLRDRVEEIDLDAERRHRAIDEVYERQYGANRAAWDAETTARYQRQKATVNQMRRRRVKALYRS